MDVSLPLGLSVAAVLYLALLFAFPEPREVYGPAGPRLVGSADTPVPPIVSADGAMLESEAPLVG